jgi:hypothetical protein
LWPTLFFALKRLPRLYRLLSGVIFGSSRKVVGFKPSKRQSKIANEGKEILIVSIAVADTLSHLDFVVEALQLARADREHGMPSRQLNRFHCKYLSTTPGIAPGSWLFFCEENFQTLAA